MKNETKLISIIVLIVLILAFGIPAGAAQDHLVIHITDIARAKQNNILGIPKKVDYTVKWMLYSKDGESVKEIDFSKIPQYVAYYSLNDSLFQNAHRENVSGTNLVTFKNLEIGKRYFFRIEGLNSGDRTVLSDTAWAISGRSLSASAEKQSVNWWHYNPLSGRFPLEILGKGIIYERSTILGKLAFHMIWWSLLIGIIIWITTMRNLSLSKIFPFKKIGLKSSLYLLNYDKTYTERISDEFIKLLQKWQKLINEAYKLVESPPMVKGENGEEIIDLDLLESEYATWWKNMGKKKIEKIEKDLTRNGYMNYPTIRIIQAGLGNHKINGYRWLEASAEVDRAIENRASSELETLKRKSFLDWLWNLGATAPLLGLFGTVTGISVAFAHLATLGPDTTHLKLVKMLAGGINEALWTTIMGLVTGIVLVILYYFYKNKLDWIFSKWEEIYVQVSEKL
ncbi:MAG: MotA/TolQ/ExbB proton channel family protein [Calditrichaeota bacterium]|nr:MotA/TolQ/ExbB proton channel family protein [Calditrichota bacterium]